jgi:hypothetical protein
VDLKLYGTYRFLKSIRRKEEYHERTTAAPTDSSREVGLEVNTEKMKYMLLSHHQNAGQSHDTRFANRWFQNVAKFKYLGTTAKKENLIQEEIKSRFNSCNVCYHSVQNILSSHLLSKNIKTKIYNVRFEVSTAVTMMIIIFWEMYSTSLCLYKSLQLRSVTCSHSCTLKIEAIRSSETSVLIRATRRHLPEDDNH